ncbi:MAG: hypothetical protein FWC27_11585 [Firmicutes bacterium]|nr:hypothetical protein [Bacillota bacterium]
MCSFIENELWPIVGSADFEPDILIEACVKELKCGLFSGGKKLGDHINKK